MESKFHVVKLFNDALGALRRKEVRDQPVLKRTKHLRNKNAEDLTDMQQKRLDSISNKRLKTARAYALRCTLQEMHAIPALAEAQALLRKLFGWMPRSKVAMR